MIKKVSSFILIVSAFTFCSPNKNANGQGEKEKKDNITMQPEKRKQLFEFVDEYTSESAKVFFGNESFQKYFSKQYFYGPSAKTLYAIKKYEVIDEVTEVNQNDITFYLIKVKFFLAATVDLAHEGTKNKLVPDYKSDKEVILKLGVIEESGKWQVIKDFYGYFMYIDNAMLWAKDEAKDNDLYEDLVRIRSHLY